MQKWGKNRTGSVRWRCSSCRKSETRKRPDLDKKYRELLFKKWLLRIHSLTEIAIHSSVSLKTISRWFAPMWAKEPQPKEMNIRDQVLIIDGKYVEKNAAVLVACTVRGVVSWNFTQRENRTSWHVFFSQLKHTPFAIVCDGQRGMLKAIKSRFPGLIIQRCQFHVMKYCLAKLTQHPETLAAQQLRILVLRIAKIKSKEQFKNWFEEYVFWRKIHHDFLKEKTYQPYNPTPTGKPTWHYTHGKLHAAHSHLKNALPNLFKYLLYPQIPNTTNFVEGAINAPMQEKLRFHRGLKLLKRRILIAHFLSSKQPQKPTQNVH